MQLLDVLRLVRRHAFLIVAVTVIGVSIGGFVGLFTPPRYQATTDVMLTVQARSDSSAWEKTQANSYAQQVIASYTEVITSALVLQPVIDSLGLDTTPQELAPSVNTSTGLKSLVIAISVDQPRPVRAARIANAIGAQFATTVAEDLEKRPADAAYMVRVVTLQSAAVPTEPSAPNLALDLGVGAVLGLAAGVGLALLRGVLDTSIHSRDELENAADVPVIGSIADDPSAADHPLIVATDPHNPRSESFRSLRTNVGFFLTGGKRGVFVVTSASPAEGKSTVSSNLALSYAETGRRVALIDADLRRPQLAQRFGIVGEAGLSDVLAHRMSANDALQRVQRSTLFLLPSGTVPPNPAELLGSQTMTQLIDDLSKAFDIVIVDTPPVLPVTDATIAARHATGVIVVAGAGKTTTGRLADAMGRLRIGGARVIGTVLCGDRTASAKGGSYAAYGTYGRGTGTASKGRSSARTTRESVTRGTE